MTKEMADEGMKGMQQFMSDPTPACIMVAIDVVWPILSTLTLSLYNWDGMTDKVFVGRASRRDEHRDHRQQPDQQRDRQRHPVEHTVRGFPFVDGKRIHGDLLYCSARTMRRNWKTI